MENESLLETKDCRIACIKTKCKSKYFGNLAVSVRRVLMTSFPSRGQTMAIVWNRLRIYELMGVFLYDEDGR